MHRVRIFAAGTVAALLALLTVAPPAFAHDELVASSPASGEALEVAPTEVSLEFSAEVMTLGAIIVVADADGTDWAATEPSVEGSVVSVQLTPDMPDAGYELRWRAVSSDGHPISGLIPFTVGDGEPLVREKTDATNADSSYVEQNQDATTGGAWRVALIGAGGAAIAVAAYALIRFLRRDRDTPAGTGTSPSVRDADDL